MNSSTWTKLCLRTQENMTQSCFTCIQDLLTQAPIIPRRDDINSSTHIQDFSLFAYI